MYPDSHDLKLSNRPVRTRMPGGVAGAPPMMEAPYADSEYPLLVRPLNVRRSFLVCQMSLAAAIPHFGAQPLLPKLAN